MKQRFYKMHGIGNDYIYFDCFGKELERPEEKAVQLSDRHFSVGGDGIILVCKSEIADGKMRMFNADGSEGKMCGNGIRCVGKFLYEIKGIQKEVLTVETLSGIKTLYIDAQDGKVRSVTVDMGAAELTPERIPAKFSGKTAIDVPLEVNGITEQVTCVSMGNPHCVIFGGDPYLLDLETIGPMYENHTVFPESVNTEFVRVLKRNEIQMRVWERGSGETWACGTGACAAAVASVLNGYCGKNEEILVHLRGGDLTVKYTDETVFMTGGAEFAFTGEVEI
ncbi:MAG: diaminopimelate epimerase [Clostridia bacterium]|jgi:diaminopimelate epimerase|nr:diaminopimelate epimerase [Clostridia bacterium]